MTSGVGGDNVIDIPAVYLLHGKGGSPNGTVSKLQQCLHEDWPQLKYVRPALPHSDPTVPAESSVEFLRNMGVEKGSLLIGISLGGLVAAKLQEEWRPDLRVVCISSPTWADGVKLERRAANRVSLYSPADEIIAERIADWPQLAEGYTLQWLTHDSDRHLGALTRLLDSYFRGDLQTRIHELL
jgi:pimeloyl-ACP methyl ester carboxylesterase